MILKSELSGVSRILISVILCVYLYHLQDYTNHKYSNTGFAKKAIRILRCLGKSSFVYEVIW